MLKGITIGLVLYKYVAQRSLFSVTELSITHERLYSTVKQTSLKLKMLGVTGTIL